MILDFYGSYTYRGSWNSTTPYLPNDLVFRSNTLFLVDRGNTGVQPDITTDDWSASPYTYTPYVPSNSYTANQGIIDSRGRLYYARGAIPENSPRPGMAQSLWVPNQLVSVLLSDIRDQVAVGLTTQDLPDSVIEKNVFLRAAELEVIQRITAAQYDAKLAIQSSRERITIAIQKRTAALIIPALPQIVENSALQERVRFLEIDWQARIELLQQEADDIIKPDIPDATAVGGSIWGVTNRFVADKYRC